jgi:CubicO group peptidase (beta-lactamase class C family)
MIEPEKVGLSSERLARIRPVIEKYVGNNKLAGVLTLLARRGELVHLECVGLRDRETNKPMQLDTIFRLHSMTKPITCVGLMMLYEKGYFQLFDPVSKFIPAFKNLRVYAGEDESGLKLVGPERPVTIRDLLTHTSGLTYHFLEYGPVEKMYREAHVSSQKPLAEFINDLLKLPLAFQPGTRWRYSFSHDVVAYLIEILSGQPLDMYLREALFEPLGMIDTGFYVPEEKRDRFAVEYGSYHYLQPDITLTKWYEDAAASINKTISRPENSLESTLHKVFRGGDGLVSTAPDYFRFCQMLLNHGELDGRRLLGRKTVELMTTNHLAPQLLPFEFGGSYWAGDGYGLGFRVLMDVNQSGRMGSVGEYSWLGAAGTYFWIDPKEELIGIHMAQFQPGGFFSSNPDFRTLAYQSIVD